MDVSDLAQLFDYAADLRGRFLATSREIGWDEATTNREATHHSMRNIFVHMLDVQDSYLQEAILGHPVAEADPDDYPSFDALEAYHQEVASTSRDFFAALQPSSLKETVRVPWWRRGKLTVESVLLHAFLDEMAHVGELVCLLWQMDVEPPFRSIVRSRTTVHDAPSEGGMGSSSPGS